MTRLRLAASLFSLAVTAVAVRAQEVFVVPRDLSRSFTEFTARLASHDKVENGLELDADSPLARTEAMLTIGGAGYCSATFLSPRTLLTAAHCVWRINPAQARVVIDVEGLSQSATVRSATPHPDYRSEGEASLLYDIGIIQLERPFPVPVRSAFLAPPEGLQEGESRAITIVGYGRAHGVGRGGGRVLRMGRLLGSVMPGGRRLAELVDPRFDQNGCRGDSGGGVLLGGPDSLQIIGVHSRGRRNNCTGSTDTRYGIAVLVWPLRDWIEPQIR